MVDNEKELLKAAEIADLLLSDKKQKSMELNKAGLSMRLYLVNCIYYLNKINAIQPTGIMRELIKGMRKLTKEFDAAAVQSGFIEQKMLDELIKTQQRINRAAFANNKSKKK